MGAGKSTALAAAREAGLETTEIDELMEARAGDADRRGLRARTARRPSGRARPRWSARCWSEADGGAIALGGGSVLSERVRDALGRHIVVWLQVDADEAWRRIAHSDRPLATSAEDVARLLAARLPLYEELADAVVPAGDRAIVARALPAIRGPGRAAGRDQDALGGERLRRVPGLRRPRPARGARAMVAAGGPALLRHRRRRRGALRRAARRRWRRGSRSSPGRGRRRWPRPSGCCASWPRPG